MIKYLLLKLAEEAGEVVVAAIKHRLHRTERTRQNLENEIGDLTALVNLLMEADELNDHDLNAQATSRYNREKKRAKKK